MTLIVYSNKTLYADDCVVLNEGHYTQRMHNMPKIDRTKCNRLAIAYLGMIPEGESRDIINRMITSSVVGYEVKEDPAAMSDSLLKAVTADGGSAFIILSRRAAYQFIETSGRPKKLNPNHEHAWGTGATGFFLCRKQGLTVLESFKKISEINRTVSNNVTKITSTSLKLIELVK